jgi:hypothetical protein
MRPSSVVTSRATSAWIAAAVFFLWRQRVLDRAQRADLFADFDELSAQFLESMKLGHFLLRLAQRRRGIEGFRNGLACHPPRQAEIGTMPRIATFRTVAVGFTALSGGGGNGPAPEITDSRKLAEQIVLFGFHLKQRVVHGGPLFLAYRNAKICATKKKTHHRRTFMSRTRLCLDCASSCRLRVHCSNGFWGDSRAGGVESGFAGSADVA